MQNYFSSFSKDSTIDHKLFVLVVDYAWNSINVYSSTKRLRYCVDIVGEVGGKKVPFVTGIEGQVFSCCLHGTDAQDIILRYDRWASYFTNASPS